MEKALEAEGKAIPPQEDVLIDTDDSVHHEPDSAKPAKQPVRTTAPAPPSTTDHRNGDQEPPPQPKPPVQRQQSSGFLDQTSR